MNHRCYAELKSRNANTGGAFTGPLGIIWDSALRISSCSRSATSTSWWMNWQRGRPWTRSCESKQGRSERRLDAGHGHAPGTDWNKQVLWSSKAIS